MGNILTRTQTLTTQVTVTTTYGYDDANRLTGVNGQAYPWDANGNWLSDGAATYGYDAANCLTSVGQGGHTYVYTSDGQGDRLTQSVDGVVKRYTLDLSAGLTQVLSDGTNTSLFVSMA